MTGLKLSQEDKTIREGARACELSALNDGDLILFDSASCLPIRIDTPEQRLLWAVIVQAFSDFGLVACHGGRWAIENQETITREELDKFFLEKEPLHSYLQILCEPGAIKRTRKSIQSFVYTTLLNNPSMLRYRYKRSQPSFQKKI